MNKNHSFVGSNVALITPMFDDGRVDYESLNNLIDFHIDSGTSSIVSVGTTGESATVGVKEHLKILDHTIKYASRRIPIIAGTEQTRLLKLLSSHRRLKILVLTPVC